MAILNRKRGKYVVFESKSQPGSWYFRQKGLNGETQATSEGYTSKRDAIRGAKAARKNARRSPIEVE